MPVKEKKTSRAEFAYDTLKRRILDNQLPPGAMLSEVALAQSCGCPANWASAAPPSGRP